MHSPAVLVSNEHVALKESDWRLHSDLTAVTLAFQVEVHDWDREELSVRADIGWHGYFRRLWLVLGVELFQTLWRRPQR